MLYTRQVRASSKRFSPFGLLYIIVFFMIASFGTAKYNIVLSYRHNFLTIC